ncbi:hypothetical protein [Nostoc sp. TCL26-01]|uniref:hypothetical protein n=1 Tax=Nostoc sp. TCL26-01 TaxID=2576904 RepID=UPI0015BDF4DB|nr:hypothetical protein [Nostoc sp. TCL26-01]QLE55101.1 hypothetical protein FD725_06000 [Nostoc sp. TCL26-01]
MLVLTYFVVILTCVAVLFYLLISYQQTQRALIWWNSRQWLRMYQAGETIQNGLLQESFVIRRHLEISSINPAFSQPEQDQYFLATIEKFHHSLKELSDYLSPPHIDNSLPLAIWYLLTKWESRLPGLKLQIELPTEWHQELPSTNRLILMILEEFLQITLATIPNTLSIFISLRPRKNFSEIMVRLTDSNIQNKTYKSNFLELDYLRYTFNFLIFGECLYQHNNNTETWYFRWQHLRTDMNI